MNSALTGLLSLSFLAGCSNSFGLLMLSEEDSGSIVDSELGGGGPGPTGGVAPSLSAFSATESGDRVRFSFQVSDPDGDLNGGTVRLTVGATEYSFAYPADVSVVGEGSASVSLDASELDRNRSYDCALAMLDRADHRSDTVRTSLTLGPWQVSVTENGDTPGDVSGLGRIEVPAIISGDIYRTGNDGSGYTADLDVVKFAVPATGNYSVVLEWAAGSADYDLFLMGTGLVTIGSSARAGTMQPELTSAPLQAGTFYYFAVGGWSGPGGAWTVRIE